MFLPCPRLILVVVSKELFTVSLVLFVSVFV